MGTKSKQNRVSNRDMMCRDTAVQRFGKIISSSNNIRVRQRLTKLLPRLDQNTTSFLFIIHITLQISNNRQSAQAHLSMSVVFET